MTTKEEAEPLAEELVAACRESDFVAVRQLLDCTSPECQSKLGLTPLVAAAEGGQLSVVRLLLEAGADPNRPTRNGNTALRAAVLLGDADIVAFLLSQGADVDLETGRGTALLTACGQGDVDMAALLLDQGASISKESRGGKTPLIAATREDASEVVKLLLSRGADPAQTTVDGMSAVEIAQVKALPKTLSLLMQAVVVKQVDRALAESDKRQAEAAVAREQQHGQALQEVHHKLVQTRAESAVRISDLRAESDKLRALYGKK